MPNLNIKTLRTLQLDASGPFSACVYCFNWTFTPPCNPMAVWTRERASVFMSWVKLQERY